MKLPHWVEKDIDGLPEEFTGQIVVECWSGGVTRLDTKTCRTAPKPGEMKRRIESKVVSWVAHSKRTSPTTSTRTRFHVQNGVTVLHY